MSREDPHFRLRIPQHLKDWLKERSDRNLRSMTGEINHILELEREREAEASKK